jgi:outer membrane protein assembly factor BamB
MQHRPSHVRILATFVLGRCIVSRTLPVLFVWIPFFTLIGNPPATVQAQQAEREEKNSFRVNAGVRFMSPDRAELRWESNLEGAASVAYGSTRKLGKFVKSSEVGATHSVVLDGLEPGEALVYRIGVEHQGKRRISPFYSIEAGMNYSVPDVPRQSNNPAGLEQLVEGLGQPGGIAVVIDPLVDSWARSLAEQSRMTVIAACNDDPSLQRFRALWYQQGVYGVRLSAQLDDDIPSGIANVVVTDVSQLPDGKRWLSPSGILVCLSEGMPPEQSLSTGPLQWESLASGVWLARQNVLESLSQWGHQYGSTANTSFVGETLGGADESGELTIRWLGRPGADFGIDRNPRMPAPLATGGRLFHQGMNRLIALDAFNGAILWSLEMPDLRRVNIPRDSANWCADADHLYVVSRDCLWVVDAGTGEMLHTLRHPEPYRDAFEWGYVAVTDESIVGTAVKTGSAYEEYWDKPNWYDTLNDASTAKVCGSSIVAYDKKYGDLRWQREVDAVLQSTMTIHDGLLYFVEVDDPALRELETGKLTDDQIWANSSVVCVDLQTGDELWKKKVPPRPSPQVIAFGLADDSGFFLETSSGGKFELVALDRKTGEPLWERAVAWSSNNHGDHMQHAVSMNGQLFIQPHILNAKDGSVIKSNTLGKRRGCATPIGAGGSIIYRGGTGPVSLWSLENERPTEFARLRPSCWLSTIPAQGMLFSPEAGGGCSCGGWMECSIGFMPRLNQEEAAR